MALNTGDQVGQYEIRQQIGAGGMALVYKAYHARLDRYVAIKVLHQTHLQNDAFRARFEREARIVARLEHPNIVPIYDYSEIGTQPYLVMKFIEGRTLRDVLRERQLSTEEVLQLMTPMAQALDYAHQQGVLHRDIKPSNIIIDGRGIPYLTDFGLARLAQAGESTMSADMMLGTPQYISPEQASGKTELDSRTDIYSLGVVLYELLTGRVPYGGSTPYAIVHDHIYSPPPLPSEINPSISPDVEQVVLKALAKNPVERHTTAGEMLSELRQAITPHTAPPPVSPQSTERPSAQPQARPPARPAAPSQAADSASAQDVSPPPIMPRPGSPTPPAPPPVPSMDDLGKQLGEIGERFGERMGQWGERFGQQMGEMGTRLGESVSSTFDGDNRRVAGRQQPRPGAKWVQKGFDGPGFYTVEELNAHERTEEADLSEDERIRRRVLKRIEARREMMGNLTAFAVIIPMLWIIWLFTGGFGSHPWPIWPTLGWGIPTAIAYFNYYNEYGNGRNRREEMIEQEVERERRRLYGDPSSAKAKNDDRSVRLTEDGELTDSFIEEIDAQQKRKNER